MAFQSNHNSFLNALQQNKLNLTLSVLFLSHCLSIEERLVNKHSFPANNYTQVEITVSAPIDSIYLGELSIVYNEGYDKKFIFRLLKKRAAARGADIICVKRKEKFQDGFLTRTLGAHKPYHTIKSSKYKVVVGIYRHIKRE